MRIGSWFIVAALLAGCPKKKPVDPDEPDPVLTEPDAGATSGGELPAELVATMDRVLALLDALGAAAREAGTDCEAMGTSFQAIADGPEGSAFAELGSGKWEDYFDEVQARYGAELGSKSEAIGTAIGTCQTNPKVDGAL
jgi:hypothetical protein